MDNFKGTYSKGGNFESLTLDTIREAISKIPRVPRYDTVIGHRAKLSNEAVMQLENTGMMVHKHDLLEDYQYFKPRTKRKRIQKKAKKYIKQRPNNNFYLIDTNRLWADWLKRPEFKWG